MGLSSARLASVSPKGRLGALGHFPRPKEAQEAPGSGALGRLGRVRKGAGVAGMALEALSLWESRRKVWARRCAYLQIRPKLQPFPRWPKKDPRRFPHQSRQRASRGRAWRFLAKGTVSRPR